MRQIIFLSIVTLVMVFTVGCSRDGSPGHEDIERAREAYSKGFYMEAEKEYERYLQVEPQGEFRKEAWDRLSEIAVNIKGDLDRAVVLLEAMYLELGIDPADAWRIMFQLGEVYAQLGNKTKAIESFEKCLFHSTDNPDNACKTQLRMALLYRAMGNYDLVAATLESCADTAQNADAKAKCLYELAQSYSFISNWSHSKRSIETLLDLDDVSEETRVLAIFLLADIYENERNYAKTKELLESIAATYPNPKVVEARLANLPYVAPPRNKPVPPSN